ncbi:MULTISPECIES: hypothetical protein [Actinomadura]|uniref:Uncharacterized protein n=1 Tax=Actinomadura yumaensis TaxID=111807 RepID=A0ABW2CCF4_9ACTN|nr:hypothetical protein [Actinomadura sp. J1-007]MWK33607.1 hypothetical protein [Actinomadura sp. J1-007]
MTRSHENVRTSYGVRPMRTSTPPDGPPLTRRDLPALPARPVLDPALGIDEGALVRRGLAAGDWRAAKEALERATDPDARYWLLDLCAEQKGRPDWLDDWVAAEPDGALPLLVRGAHGVKWAWEARGPYQARYTGDDAMVVFQHRLVTAEDDLLRAASRDPNDPTPWACLLTSGRGLGVGVPELERRFTEVTVRHRWHVGAHGGMLMGTSRKWGGTHDLMFDFAREAASLAPAGSPIAGLLAAAHLEPYLFESKARMAAYLSHPEVRGELRWAAERSVLHPDAVPTLGTIHAHNHFAYCFAAGGDVQAAARHFAALGGRVAKQPWFMFTRFSSPARLYGRHRRAVRRRLPR